MNYCCSRSHSFPAVVLGLGLILFAGCEQPSANKPSAPSSPPVASGAHVHPTEGPHHGSLIELGNEEYHAEVVHDEKSGMVTLYLLDSSAKNSVSIAANEILVNLSHAGQAEQFPLPANPQSSDPDGHCSRFASPNPELYEELDHEGTNAQLVVTIGGKQYRGTIDHDADHSGHADHSDHADEGNDHTDGQQ